ncbi:MAG: hypothetical protein JSR82_05145 [Verrucomicrobia bacterium]|nr:hypothetical protein [Verrucomicrobiota bacterium]
MRTTEPLTPVRFLAAAFGFLACGTAAAATFTVSNVNDSGPGSLRQAVLDANANAGADTIVFDASLSGRTIPLLSQINITSGGLTITAAALPNGITISGQDAHRVFGVGGTSLDLIRLRLVRGNTGTDGGAIFLNSSLLTLTDCTFTGNHAANGGAIYAAIGSARVYASGCTFDANVASDDGGAVYLGGSINFSIFSNCTFSSNLAETQHGAVTVLRTEAFFNHCTVFANKGGLFGTGGICAGQPITLNRCIVAGNTSDSLASPDIFRVNSVAITATDPNLIGSNGGTSAGNVSAVFPAGPLVGTPTALLDPRLRPLGPSGGPSWTHAPLANSAALNAGGASPFAVDQRGFPRDVGGSCDLGAVERGPILTVNSSADSGAGSLRAVLAAVTQPDTRIQFASFLNGVTINLSTGPLDVAARQVDLDASTLAAGVIISSNSTSRLFNVTGGQLTLNRFILRDGLHAANGGAILATDAGLVVIDVAFPSNRAGASGGAIAVLRGSAALHRCSLYGGTANAAAGFYGEGPGRYLLTNCTLSANDGGGAEVRNAGSELELVHCTVTGHTSRAGVTVGTSAVGRFENCLVAGNSGPVSPDINLAGGNVVRVGANLVGNNGGANTGNVTDEFPAGPLVGTPAAQLDALVAPLDNYGGGLPFTRTHALRAGSPARDAAFSTIVLRDQRGLPRVNAADLGAYEAGQRFPTFLAYIWETLPPSATLADHAADADFDGDGSSNYQEYLTSNDPTNPKSFFRPTVRLADGLLLVAFPTVAGRSYAIESSTNLTTWTAQGTIFGDGQATELFVSATGSPKIYARIRVAP